MMRIFSRNRKDGPIAFNAWQIEITTRCPLACRMCVKEACPDWLRKDMAVEDFERILPYLKGVKNVVLEGWGESLMHPRLNDFIRLAKAQGPAVGFVTSGYGLDQKRSRELIALGIDFVGFSLSGGMATTHNRIRIHSEFHKLQEAISTFRGLIGSHRLKGTEVHIVYLGLKENIAELPLVIDEAHRLGIGEVIVINLVQVATAWQEEQKLFSCRSEGPYRQIMDEARKKAKRLNVKLMLPDITPRDVAVCSENPLENLYISVEGEVSPCVYLQPPVPTPFPRIYCGETFPTAKVSFGNIFWEDFATIWESPEYVAFRKAFEGRNKAWNETVRAFMEMRMPEATSLPDAPLPCRTCHKMLGF
jgi:MoaA/NifB/PqqE/SkfB family radical SAM enzyme